MHLPSSRRSIAGYLSVPVLLLLVVFLVFAAAWPSPYALMLPGDAIAVIPRVEVPPDHAQPAGQLFFTVVNVKPATWGEWARASVNPNTEEIVPADDLWPPGIPREVMAQYETHLMDESKTVATVVALRKAGYTVEAGGQGARVVAILPDSPAASALQQGDVIVSADGQPMPTALDLVTAMQKKKPGDSVRLAVKRGDRTLDLTLPTVESTTDPGRPMVGALLLTELFDFHLPFPVQIQTDNIGGPSAGLMFALGVYDRVTPGELGGGHKIAGTGTIALDGTVGPIGGAAEKVIAAERAGADVFLAPKENYAEARGAADHIRVVEVGSFDDALAAVQHLDATPAATS